MLFDNKLTFRAIKAFTKEKKKKTGTEKCSSTCTIRTRIGYNNFQTNKNHTEKGLIDGLDKTKGCIKTYVKTILLIPNDEW